MHLKRLCGSAAQKTPPTQECAQIGAWDSSIVGGMVKNTKKATK
jgi:hypothetical protein